MRLKEQGSAFLRGDQHTNQVQVLNALMEDKDSFFDTALVGL